MAHAVALAVALVLQAFQAVLALGSMALQIGAVRWDIWNSFSDHLYIYIYISTDSNQAMKTI